MKIILGSASPRRKELLGMLGYEFEVQVRETDEKIIEGSCEEIVEAIAKAKAEALSDLASSNRLIVCGDTIVVIDGEILGKPEDAKHAKKMLKRLSGKIHHVYSGIALRYQDQIVTFANKTEVEFCKLSKAEIEDYLESKEPYGKAGSYAIQGIGSKFVKRIAGDYYNVVGLPVSSLYQQLKKFEQGYYTYMIRCNDNSLYTGWTNDLEKRIQDHKNGQGAKYTRAKPAEELVYLSRAIDKKTAMRMEYQIKQLTRKQKEALILEKQLEVLGATLTPEQKQRLGKISLAGIPAEKPEGCEKTIDDFLVNEVLIETKGLLRLNYQHNLICSYLTEKFDRIDS